MGLCRSLGSHSFAAAHAIAERPQVALKKDLDSADQLGRKLAAAASRQRQQHH
jgi:hypothetical protein